MLPIFKNFNSFTFTVIFLISAKSEYIGVEIPDKLLSELYSTYKDALNIDEGTVSYRRVFADSKKYQIHVMKLYEVNGHKRHNLMIKEDNSTNPIIYINNPVETKIPNAYLTFEEFKQELTDRVLRLREEFATTVTEELKATTQKSTEKPEKNDVKDKLFLKHLIKIKQDPKLTVKTKKESVRTEKPVILRANLKTNTKAVLTRNNTKVNKNITKLLIPKETTNQSNVKEKIEENYSKATETNPTQDKSLESSIPIPHTEDHTDPTTENTEIDNTELHTESQVNNEQELTETFESTPEIESTTTEEATEASKIIKLSKPLVWMGGDKSQNVKN